MRHKRKNRKRLQKKRDDCEETPTEVLSPQEINELLKAISASDSDDGSDDLASFKPKSRTARISHGHSFPSLRKSSKLFVGSTRAPVDSRIAIYDFARPAICCSRELTEISNRLITLKKLSSALRDSIGIHVQVSLSSVDQLNYDEFMRSLPLPSLKITLKSDYGQALVFMDALVCACTCHYLVGGTQETWASTAERLKKHWPKFATIVQHELHRAIASLICSALNEQCNEVFRVERVEYDESQYKRTTIKSRDMGILCSWEMSFPLDTTRSDHVEGMLNVFFPAAVARAHCITPAVKPIASSLDLDDTTVSLEIRTKTLAFSLSDVRKLKEGSMLSFPSSRVRVTSSGRAFFEGEVKKLTPSISISVLSTLKEKSMTKNPEIVDSINDIDITISVELGRKRVTLRDIKQISAGSMIELDKMAGEPVDIFANNSLIGKGEVCVTSGDIMTIRVVDINDESILDD